MSVWSLFTLILSAFMHATWNFLAKRSNGGTVFVWFYSGVSTLFTSPIAIFFLFKESFSMTQFYWLIILISIILHIIYSLTLQFAYKTGDMTLVYPVARGTGPFIVAIIAVFFLKETISVLSGTGILFIITSIFILSGGFTNIKRKDIKTPLTLGIFIGLIIASYTLIDKAAVSYILISPYIYYFFMIAGQFIFITIFALKKPVNIKIEFKKTWKYAIAVGILSSAAYLLVLIVMTFEQVSYVAPIRETSIVIGTIMAVILLSERGGRERIIGSFLMIVGIFLIAIS